MKAESVMWIMLLSGEIQRGFSGGIKPLLIPGSLTNHGYHLLIKDFTSLVSMFPPCESEVASP